ncbi:hypothetical protein HG537_0D04110 [Torulaspora globosa]|uniref:Uncharacterized protein n=1 Tax=Torulaspora globosa TaxID=48254 RepID=A0A7H9HSS8_9SACH|nr:hypothetical protein HG537_0D04110 [Torulaspora sp. CBS 2947]
MTTVLRLKETNRPGPTADLSEHTYGRRVAIRKWFHNLYREKPDEKFDGDECISLEEAESLVMVPSFNLTSGQTTTESSRSASPEKKQTHSHRDKIREFKMHLKIKLSHFKHRHSRGVAGNGNVEKDVKNDADKADADKADLCVQKLFVEQNENDQMDGKAKSSADDGTDVLAEISTSKTCEDRGNEHAEDSADQELAGATSAPASAPTSLPLEGTCRTKRLSNDDRNIASIKRPCSSKAVGPSPSDESSEDTSDANQLEQSSMEKTPSACLAKSPISSESESAQHAQAAADTQPIVDSSSESYETTSDSMEDSDDFSSSEDVSSADEPSTIEDHVVQPVEEACISPIASEKIYTIPTFRKKVGTLNVANIVKSVREGTLNQDKLIEIANKGLDGHGDLTFRNKEFYDDPTSPSINENEKIDDKKPAKELRSSMKDNSKPTKKNQKPGSVKFDKFSCLIVYERSVNANPSRTKETTKEPTSLNACEGTVRLNKKSQSSMQGQKGTGTKSILRVKTNLRAKEENRRANACDRVGVDSFMDLFEHFENKKQMEEYLLPGAREGQLNNYFSENFFPEILEDITITTSANSEFSRSRRATESNIGRKLGPLPRNWTSSKDKKK